MKKLLMTMAASVAAIGLTYAEDEVVSQETEAKIYQLLNSFGDGVDKGGNEYNDGFDQALGQPFNPDNAPWGNVGDEVIWKTSETEGIIVTNKTGVAGDVDFHLKLETAKSAPLLRTFAVLGEGSAVKPIETNVVVDAMISFTGFEEAPVPTEGEDKILVWMKATETETVTNENGEEVEVAGVTNLMITAGMLDGDSIGGRATYPIGNAEVGKEYRVTIKSIGNIAGEVINGGVLGFEVYIDGTQVKFAASGSDFWGSASDVTLLDNVFPALVTGTTLKAAGFEGTGTIDDVLVCAADNEEMAPDFTLGGGDVVIAPIAPGGESEELDTEDDATKLAGTINDAADKSQYITVPAGIDASKYAYLEMFEAVASGKKVLIQLTTAAKEALQAEVDNLSTNATTSVAALLSTLASAGVDDDDQVLKITGGKPGFWYSIESGAELNGMEEGDRAMANDDGAVTLTVPVIKVGGQKSGKGFYKVLINVKDKVKVPAVE